MSRNQSAALFAVVVGGVLLIVAALIQKCVV